MKTKHNANGKPLLGENEQGFGLKDMFIWNGLVVCIENIKGSIRRGFGWEAKMNHHYGYIHGTIGEDGDPLDVFVGNYTDCEKVFVVYQNDPETGMFDEEKVMLGFKSRSDAKEAYLSNYDNPKFFGWMSEYSIEDFKNHVVSEKKMKSLRLSGANAIIKGARKKLDTKGRWVTIDGRHVHIDSKGNADAGKIYGKDGKDAVSSNSSGGSSRGVSSGDNSKKPKVDVKKTWRDFVSQSKRKDLPTSVQAMSYKELSDLYSRSKNRSENQMQPSKTRENARQLMGAAKTMMDAHDGADSANNPKKSPLDKDNDKPLTERQANPERFKKPAHQKTAGYKMQPAEKKRISDVAHDLSKIDMNKVSPSDQKSLNEIMNKMSEDSIHFEKIDLNETHRSGNPYYDADEKKTLRQFNKWYDKHGGKALTPQAISELFTTSDYIEQYTVKEDVKKLSEIMTKIVKEHKVAVDPNQLRMFKGIISSQIDIMKGKKMPVGTVSRGYKKVSEGKWVPVGKQDGKSASQKIDAKYSVHTKSEADAIRNALENKSPNDSFKDLLTLMGKENPSKEVIDYLEDHNQHKTVRAIYASQGRDEFGKRMPTGKSLEVSFPKGFSKEQIKGFLGDSKVKVQRITEEKNGSMTIVVSAPKGNEGNFELEVAQKRLVSRGANRPETFDSYDEELTPSK